jgi:hypothetical protein
MTSTVAGEYGAAGMKLCIAALVAAFAATGAAWAAEPVASAGGAGPATSTAQQIDAFLKAAPVPDLPSDGAAGVTTSGPADHAVHGMVEVGVGSGGYRHAFAAVQGPLGDSGTLSIAVDESRFRDRFGGWRSRQFGADLAFGAAAQDPMAGPCVVMRPDAMADRRTTFGGAPGCGYGATANPLGAGPP